MGDGGEAATEICKSAASEPLTFFTRERRDFLAVRPRKKERVVAGGGGKVCREEEEKEGCCFALRIIRLNEKPRGEGLEKKFEVSRFLPPWEQWAPDSCPTATCFFCCKRCLPPFKPSLS